MTPEQNLIQQISLLLENNQLENQGQVEDLAAQYAELCGQVNTRLLRCVEYLEKGLLSEAVYEARMSPDLLELAELVQFEAGKKWRNVCVDLAVAVPPMLHVELMARVREACLQERALEPLLKEFRTLVYQGQRRGALEVLRRIRESDPENASWRNNLLTFENEELPQWMDRAEEALERGDLVVLREIHGELTHPQRMAPVPAGLLQRVRRALLSERSRQLQGEAQGLLAGLQEALGRQDLAEAGRLLAKAGGMQQDEAFVHVPDGWQETLNEARSWQSQAEAEAARRQEFQVALAGLRAKLVGKHAGELELRQEWERVQEWGYPLPELLSAQVSEVLSAWQRRRLNRGRYTWVMVAVALVLLAAVVVVGWQQRRVSGGRARLLAQLESDWRDGRLDDMAYRLEALQASHPEFYQQAEVKSLRSQLESRRRELAERDRQLERIVGELAVIRRGGYDRSPEEIMALLTAGRDLQPGEGIRSQLESWESGWNYWRQTRRQESNGMLSRAALAVRNAYAEQRRNPFVDLAAEQEAIRGYERGLVEAEGHVARADEAMQAEYVQAREVLAGWERERLQREQAQREQAQARAQQEKELADVQSAVFRAPPDLVAYRGLLQRLAELSGGMLPALFRDAWARLEDQERALELRQFVLSGLPPSAAEAKALQGSLEAGSLLLGSVWEEDLRWCVRYVAAEAAVRQKLRRLPLDQTEMFEVYCIYYRKPGEAEWRPLYLPAMLTSREEKQANGALRTLYWGQVYHTDDAEGEPVLMHSSRVFPQGLHTGEYEIRVERREQDNFAPQRQYINEFMLATSSAAELDVAILRGLQRLEQVGERLEPVPRAWLAKRLVNFLSENYSEHVPESVEWAKAYQGLPTQVPWMNRRHPAVFEAEEAIRRRGRILPDLELVIETVGRRRQVYVQALSRRLECVGVMVQDGVGLQPLIRGGGRGGELWVLASGEAGRPEWRVLSFGGGRLESSVLGQAYVGQLLFSPRGVSAAQSLEAFTPVQRQKLTRPFSWPANAW